MTSTRTAPYTTGPLAGIPESANLVDAVCDSCHTDPAVVDTPTIFGPWAHLCIDCAPSVGRLSPSLSRIIRRP